MSGVTEGDPRTEYKRRNAQLRATAGGSRSVVADSSRQQGSHTGQSTGFTGGLFQFNESGGDPRTDYRRRAAQGIPVSNPALQQAPRPTNFNTPTGGDPRTRYRTANTPPPSVVQPPVNRPDSPQSRSERGGSGKSFFKFLGNVLGNNEDNLSMLGRMMTQAAPAPPPPVVRINRPRVENRITVASSTSSVASATTRTANADTTQTSQIPSTTSIASVATTLSTHITSVTEFDNAFVDPEWLAATAHIDDIDHPPNEYSSNIADIATVRARDTSQKDTRGAIPPAAAPVVPPLTDAERQAMIDEMVATFEFGENPPGNEELSDDDEPRNDGTIYDEVSELGNSTFAPIGNTLSHSELQELYNLRMEVYYRRIQESLELQESVPDEDSTSHSALF